MKTLFKLEEFENADYEFLSVNRKQKMEVFENDDTRIIISCACQNDILRIKMLFSNFSSAVRMEDIGNIIRVRSHHHHFQISLAYCEQVMMNCDLSQAYPAPGSWFVGMNKRGTR